MDAKTYAALVALAERQQRRIADLEQAQEIRVGELRRALAGEDTWRKNYAAAVKISGERLRLANELESELAEARAEVEKWHRRAQGQADIADHTGMELMEVKADNDAQRARVRELEGALLKLNGSNNPDNPCWCWTRFERNGDDHDEGCVQALAALRRGEKELELDKEYLERLSEASASEEFRLSQLVKEIEAKYRRQLWLSHGHTGLYGDDGEMQCGKCRTDFKRSPLDQIEKLYFDCTLERTQREKGGK